MGLIKVLRFLIIFFIISSCQQKTNRKEEIKYYLTNDKEKYWIMMKEGRILRTQGRLFQSNHFFVDFYLKDVAKNDKKYFKEMHFMATWEVLDNDTLFICGSDKLKIEYINEDIMILNSPDLKSISVWIKANDQKSKIKIDTTRDFLGL